MQFANIEWRENKGAKNSIGQPYSLDFNDVYFNTDDGLAESEHVFITHNKLQQRFSDANLSSFTMIETGFGTGLNFLAVSALWLQLAPKSATLHYIGIEKTPLSIADLTRAQALWPQFTDVSQAFITQYSTLESGTNHFSIAAGRIQLVLQADDITLALPQLSQIADAWLLDGFAPAKNTAMWSSEVFAQMARLSKKGSTFATFTSAGHVKRGLYSVGFEVSKHKGFGKKREMLSGIFTGKN
jgi:tRNA 5-methylaminomethyl-2-thiouridine biosynthesis bifunctional protein